MKREYHWAKYQICLKSVWYKWYERGKDKTKTRTSVCQATGELEDKQGDGLKGEEREQNTEKQWPAKLSVTVRDSFY